MLNTESGSRRFKDQAYAAFAECTKALGSPRRLELLDLLVQGPRSVDALARGVGQPVPNTSQHLQVLKRARLVETQRRGTRVDYRLAPGVAQVFVALRRLAEARKPEIAQAKAAFFEGETIDRQALQAGLDTHQLVLVDVRPREEFARSHIEGALSFPVQELEGRLDELPSDRLIVATCRGPYCAFAGDAVRILEASGRRACRFEDGVAEWAADGGELA